MLFKGPKPNRLNVKAYPSIYVFGESDPYDVMASGLHVTLSETIPGDFVDNTNMSLVDGLYVAARMERLSNTLQTSRSEKSDFFTLCGDIGGAFEFLLAAFGAAVLFTDQFGAKIKEKFRKKEHFKVANIYVFVKAETRLDPKLIPTAMYYVKLNIGTAHQFKNNDLDEDMCKTGEDRIIKMPLEEEFLVEVKYSYWDFHFLGCFFRSVGWQRVLYIELAEGGDPDMALRYFSIDWTIINRCTAFVSRA